MVWYIRSSCPRSWSNACTPFLLCSGLFHSLILGSSYHLLALFFIISSLWFCIHSEFCVEWLLYVIAQNNFCSLLKIFRSLLTSSLCVSSEHLHFVSQWLLPSSPLEFKHISPFVGLEARSGEAIQLSVQTVLPHTSLYLQNLAHNTHAVKECECKRCFWIKYLEMWKNYCP